MIKSQLKTRQREEMEVKQILHEIYI